MQKISHSNNRKSVGKPPFVKRQNGPFCSTCHKAGLPIAEYTNHWTKSSPGPEGVVICPTILNTQCGYCHDLGHWTKFCPKIQSRRNWTNNDDIVDDDIDDDIVDDNIVDEPVTMPFRPHSPDCPPPGRKTYSQIAATVKPIDIPTVTKKYIIEKPEYESDAKSFDIHHSWADDEYWD